MDLQKTGEAVIITPLGYSMVRKCPYYLDKTLKDKADRIKKINEGM